MDGKLSLKGWLALAGLACSAFVFNTSEFIPIGLLTDIAADFRVTEAKAGMLISVYAWMVALLSLPLMLACSKMNLRKLLLWVVFLFAFFQVCSALSPGYYALMFARIGVACTHSIFWSIVSPLGVRIVPPRYKALALSVIVTGSAIAMIFGMPLGRVIGLHIGWRATFMSIGGVSLLTFLYLRHTLPSVPSRGGFALKKLPSMVFDPLLLRIYLFTLLIATAYFTGYSYIEPFLKQTAGFADSLVTATLMVFGAAGLIGSALFSKFYAKAPGLFVTLCTLSLCLCLLALLPLSGSMPAEIAACAVWGAAATAFNVALQSQIIACTPPEGTAVSMSVYSGIFNLGIGSGTLIGGVVCTYAAISYIGIAGAVIGLPAVVYWHLRTSRMLVR